MRRKHEDNLALNVSEVRTIADLFVILSGCGERQVQTIADAMMEKAHDWNDSGATHRWCC